MGRLFGMRKLFEMDTNRRGFLRLLGIGAGVAVAAPVLANIPTKPEFEVPPSTTFVPWKLGDNQVGGWFFSDHLDRDYVNAVRDAWLKANPNFHYRPNSTEYTLRNIEGRSVISYKFWVVKTK